MPSVRALGKEETVHFHYPGRKELLKVNRKYGIKTCIGGEDWSPSRGADVKTHRYAYLGEATYLMKGIPGSERMLEKKESARAEVSERNWLSKKLSSIKSFFRNKMA